MEPLPKGSRIIRSKSGNKSVPRLRGAAVSSPSENIRCAQAPPCGWLFYPWNAASSAAFQGVGGKGWNCNSPPALPVGKGIAVMLAKLRNEITNSGTALMQGFNQARESGAVFLVPLARHLRSTLPEVAQV